MARLESVLFRPHRSVIDGDRVSWSPIPGGKEIKRLPMIFWDDGTPWREANLWALEAASSGEIDIRTVQSRATSLLLYANWLDSTGTAWWDFPLQRKMRCLVRYRGELIKLRKDGRLAASTVSQRMQVAIQFYRWLRANALFSTAWPTWEERIAGVHLKEPTGFERTISVVTTDLSIINRRIPGERLEDGLLPVRAVDRDSALEFASINASEELFLMLSLGFFTGMRIGTIADLKIQTLENAVPDPAAKGFFRIAVGPASHPPVATKFGVDGQIAIAEPLLNRIKYYASSPRRLKREASASSLYKDVIFLTRYGNPYCARGTQNSNAINVEMHAFRERAVANGLPAMRNFHFHQSRCTFATELARLAIRLGGSVFAVSMLRKVLLHKNETTSLAYIKFVEETPIKEEAANAFSMEFLGLLKGGQGADNA